MRYFYLFLSLIIILFGITFSILNAQSVFINLYVVEWSLPLSLLVILSIILGSLLGMVIMLTRYFRLSCLLRKCQQQMRIQEKEIQNLRIMPIKNEH